MNEPQIPKQTEGQEAKETTATDETQERIKKINDAADRLEQAERRLSERENSLREAEAIHRLGGRTNAGQLKLTPEEEAKAEAQKIADEIAGAFKRR